MTKQDLEQRADAVLAPRASADSGQTRSLAEYAADLSRIGIRPLQGEPGTFWTKYGTGALMRQPMFYLTSPAAQEVRRILWRTRTLLASYLREPDAHHPANAWLYLCADQSYSLEKLDRSKRSHVRVGLRELRIAQLSPEQLLAHGAPAYCETRRRLELSDGTPDAFRRYVTGLSRLPEYAFLGAWKDEQLAAFLVIVEVDDWVDMQGTYSMDTLRQYRPNETLVYSALCRHLVDRRCRLVSNGVSSLAEASNAAGLHQFKTEVGFEARPVHRAFMFHPLLRPVANRFALQLALQGVNAAMHFMPEHKRLRKACGVLSSMLGDTHMLGVAAGAVLAGEEGQ